MFRFFALLLLLTALAGTLGACGTDLSSGDDQQVAQEQLDAARDAGRDEERRRQEQRDQEQRTRTLERKLRKLQRDNRRGNAGGSSASRAATPAPSTPAPATPAPSAGNCGGGVTANSNTSCPFALNVRNEYMSTGSSVVEVYSSATGQTYTMSCSGSGPTVCTGGNNARVEFG